MVTGTMDLPVETGRVRKATSRKSEKDGPVARDKPVGRVPLPDRIGPAPDQRATFVLADPGPLGDGEFDITIGGDLYSKGGLIFGINRSVTHRNESLTVNGDYVELQDADDRLTFEYRGREYSLRVLWPNGVRISTRRTS